VGGGFFTGFGTLPDRRTRATVTISGKTLKGGRETPVTLPVPQKSKKEQGRRGAKKGAVMKHLSYEGNPPSLKENRGTESAGLESTTPLRL